MTIDEINALSPDGFVAAIGHLFEHSPWVAEAAAGRRPFRDAAELQAELCAALRRAPRARQRALIEAHPDLAGRLSAAGALTADSAREQASAGLDRLRPDAAAEFQRLNDRYRERFGFPFILCARLHDAAAIRRALEERLSRSPEEEFAAALGEIEKIAELRLRDVLVPRP
jgi:OHCU decarboxylase